MRSFLGNAIMEKENKKKGQVMNIINKLSVVISVYNEEAVLDKMYQAVVPVVESLPCEYELLFVNDGSKDASPAILDRLAMESEKVKVIHFSRNYGHEAAMIAGIDYSTGDGVICMDADLQHPPELLLDMVKGIEEGYECCGARRVNRNGEPPIRSAFSRLFYRMAAKLTSTKMEQGTTDYRLMSRRFVNAVLAIGEKNRFTKGIFAWVGFDTKWIEYENVERAAGNTKWSFSGLLRYAVNGFMSFATAPLRGAVYLGFIVMIVALVYGIYIALNMLISGGVKSGYSSIMFAILFIGSIIILLLGIIGEYLARIYMEVKNRPIYIAKDEKLDENTELKD